MIALASRFGTPLYVYDLRRVRRAAHDLRASLPLGARLYYSLKANPHPRIVSELASLGYVPEISSTGELAAVVDPASALYTGPGKTPEETSAAISAGVGTFSIESIVERDRLGASVDYVVRINASTRVAAGGLRMTGTPSQFGVPEDQCAPLLQRAAGARPVGVHLYPATNVWDEDSLIAEFGVSIQAAAKALTNAGIRDGMADLGGGFAAPFARPGSPPVYRGLRAGLESMLDEHLPNWRWGDPVIAFESGRYLTATCGTLLTRVLDVKKSGDRTFLVLDAGVNVLGGMSGLGRMMAPAVQPASAGPPVTLAGPLCTPLDILSRNAAVTARPGDVLSIPNVGAYGLTTSLVGFLSRPIAAEVIVDEGDTVVDARRLTLVPTTLQGEQ